MLQSVNAATLGAHCRRTAWDKDSPSFEGRPCAADDFAKKATFAAWARFGVKTFTQFYHELC